MDASGTDRQVTIHKIIPELICKMMNSMLNASEFLLLCHFENFVCNLSPHTQVVCQVFFIMCSLEYEEIRTLLHAL